MQERDNAETPPADEQSLAIRLPNELVRYLLELEAHRGELAARIEPLEKERAWVEQCQIDRLRGYFEGACLGVFRPDEWELKGALLVRIVRADDAG